MRSALANGRRPGAPGPIAFAVATGVTIAAYIDGRPRRDAADRSAPVRRDHLADGAVARPLGRRRGRRCVGTGWREPEVARRAAVGGILTLVAYLLVLYALSVAPLSAVAPLRESATVVAAAWGAVRMGEAVSRGDATRRIVASAVIVAGAILLAVDA